MELLEKEYSLTVDQINALYHYGQYQYTYGDYSGAASYLYHFLILSPSQHLNLSAHWGKLASNILSGSWDAALEEVKDLRDLIDNPHSAATAKPTFQLQARTWLLHWSLFVFFNHEDGRQALLDMFLSPAYLNTMQTSCPHLLRYLVAAAIICRRSTRPVVVAGTTRTIRDPIKECTRIVLMEEYQFSDPITGFLKDLYGDFDFEGAQERLKVAEQVIENDFFLGGFATEFVENARWLISEVYCRIHRRIDITDLSSRLNLSKEEGEKWIVNLIRDSKLGIDAKIDLKANMLHISRPHPTPTATLIETTKGLAFRSQAIQYAMQRKAAGEGGEQQRGERGGRGGGRGGGAGRGGRGGHGQGQGQQSAPAAVAQEA
jgi:translation initiation factor 3 subunit E